MIAVSYMKYGVIANSSQFDFKDTSVFPGNVIYVSRCWYLSFPPSHTAGPYLACVR